MKLIPSAATLLLTGLIWTCLASARIAAEPIAAGSSQFVFGTGKEAITVFTHKPDHYAGGPLLMVMHGMNRNAEDYRNYAITLATRLKVIVAAPHFDKDRFSTAAYNRGGIIDDAGQPQPREQWTYTTVLRIVEDIRTREGKPDLAYSFIGHSGGGQFLVRLAAFSPGAATRIVAANPGSLLFPRRDWNFGYGFGGLPEELSNEATLRRYLAAPLTLNLGTADIDPNHDVLDKSKDAMLQGGFRLERGRACYEFARKLAAEKGWPFHWRKVETEGIGHDGEKMFAAPEATEALTGTK